MWDVPWYIPTICSKFHSYLFGNFFRIGRNKRYDIMWAIDAYGNMHAKEPDNESSGAGRPIPNNPTADALASIGITLNLINNWLQCFESNYTVRTVLHKQKMTEFFKTITLTLPVKNPDDHKNKHHNEIKAVGGAWFIENQVKTSST